ncbi:hypothetical protein PHYBOEH_006217 [Phytophthora boehmeriae]|uniref:HTH CENPB-type domain-containing protein n=1 Tax=Phytophthora boehmeriae TaxID=109152 RepID=A0A8T1WK98_9STRA|nr:hypothetical protein PHYBOEH_006217 [Phytophthora boehmeriae]
MVRYKNRSLTLEQREAIIRQYDKQPEWKQMQLAQWVADTFQLEAVPSQPTISVVLRQSGRFMKPARSSANANNKIVLQYTGCPCVPKPVNCREVEVAMVKWLEHEIERDVAITVSNVQAKAEELKTKLKITVEGFNVSESWVDWFLRKHLLNCPFDSESANVDWNAREVVKPLAMVVEEKAEPVEARKKRLDAKANSRTPRPTGKRKREISINDGGRRVRTRK